MAMKVKAVEKLLKFSKNENDPRLKNEELKKSGGSRNWPAAFLHSARFALPFSLGENRLHLRKIQINLVFRSVCTTFAGGKDIIYIFSIVLWLKN